MFLIVARVIQGFGGGAMQPIAQAVLLESFPPAKRGVAMAIYGMGVVVAPIIGPTLGGWITDSYSWRWVFYINLPVGILAVLLVQMFVDDPPYIRNAARHAHRLHRPRPARRLGRRACTSCWTGGNRTTGSVRRRSARCWLWP